MEYISNTLGNLVEQTAFMSLTFGNLIMIAVACVFLYLAIRHEFEPLLLVPIAFGMLLVISIRILCFMLRMQRTELVDFCITFISLTSGPSFLL